MAFASVLDGFCSTLKCSNAVIASKCELSSSTLSRYRNGRRTPNPGSPVIERLAHGIASLARENGIAEISSQDEISQALRASLSLNQPLGMGFAARLDSLMQLLGIRNAEIAQVLRLDSSYISRIRHGERTPSNKDGIAETAAQIATVRCMEHDVLEEVLGLIGANDVLAQIDMHNMEEVGLLARAIKGWLLGSKVTDQDVESVLSLFEYIDKGDYNKVLERTERVEPPLACSSPLEASMQFYRGEGFMWKAELAFLSHALKCGAHDLILSTDMPAFEAVLPDTAIEEYQRAVVELIRNGSKVVVIHSTDRTLSESVRAMKAWIPLYMTGSVTPLYLSGMVSQLFYHTNNVCDCCAMSSEAIRGHEKDGQYFLSTRAEDIAYYRTKMNHIKEQASVMLEIYRNDNPEEMSVFERDEALRQRDGLGRVVCAERFRNLTIVTYPGDCIVLTMNAPQGLRFVIRHPKLRYAVSHLK